MGTPHNNLLGRFLKDRRARLDAAALGCGSTRRRTPGLRREEVAHRADISVTWYTWLEQGRGGTASADVLDRVAGALLLSAAEREHLHLLAHDRPPGVRDPAPMSVTPRLQRVLDAMAFSPAFVKTAAWDVVAWNHAAAAVLTDYGALPPARRNILRLLFCDPHARARLPHWEDDARLVVATFRLAAARAGAVENAEALVDELSRSSPEFAAMWLDNDVGTYGEGTKLLDHPVAGRLALEYSAFAVDGRPDLGLVVYTPSTPADLGRVQALLTG